MSILTVVTNMLAIVGIYFIVRDNVMPMLKQIICKYISKSNEVTSQNGEMLDEYIEIDDYTKSWRISTSGCHYISKPSVWSVSSLSSTSSTSSLDIDFSLPSPLCPLTSTRKYSIWSLNSDSNERYLNNYSSGSSSSSVGPKQIGGFNWSSSSTSFRPSFTSFSEGSSSNNSTDRFPQPSLTSIDEDVFQEDTLGFKAGYYSLTTVNMVDMFSLSSDIHDTDESTTADSAIGSGGTTPERQDNQYSNIEVDSPISSCCTTPDRPGKKAFNTDLTTPSSDDKPFPLVDLIDYEKPPGPSPYGMRRRRVFTFGIANKN